MKREQPRKGKGKVTEQPTRDARMALRHKAIRADRNDARAERRAAQAVWACR